MSPENRNEFERYPALASWIERMGASGSALPLGEWMTFLGALNLALTAARAERDAEVERQGWQDISSAPKDGTHILVTRAGGGGFGYCGPLNKHGFRDPADWCDVVHWFDDPDLPGFYSSDYGVDQQQPFTGLTHWQPLPAALTPEATHDR